MEQRSFSLAGYGSLLAAGSGAGYRFVTFADVAAAGDSLSGRLCLMRHDIDVNIRYALTLARLEAEAGVAATYFLMLRSPAYNLLGRAAAGAVREIVALGHDLGVHFDAQHPIVTDDNMVELALREAEIIAELARRPVRAISFHQPSRAILDRDIDVPGLINTYSRRQLDGWHYVSDSNRNWRGQSPWDLLKGGEKERLQILTHPMWWVSDALGTEAVWDAAVLDNLQMMQTQFLETEAAYGSARRFRVEGTPGTADA